MPTTLSGRSAAPAHHGRPSPAVMGNEQFQHLLQQLRGRGRPAPVRNGSTDQLAMDVVAGLLEEAARNQKTMRAANCTAREYVESRLSDVMSPQAAECTMTILQARLPKALEAMSSPTFNPYALQVVRAFARGES